MPRGFIRDKLQLKVMILYILDLMAQPINLSQLMELSLCDEAVDYFSFAEALSELTETGHIALEGEGYTITLRGQEHCQECKSTVPSSVRSHCEENARRIHHGLL